MRRYWVEQSFQVHDQYELTEDLFHHIIGVCRQDVGCQFELINAKGEAFFVQVIACGKKSATVKILELRKLPQIEKPYIKLALSIPKPSNLDSIIERAVEMGVHEMKLFTSDYSFFKHADPNANKKSDRWRKIIISATQQSGRGDLMQIAEPIPLKDLLKNFNQTPHAQGLFAYEGSAANSMKDYVSKIKGVQSQTEVEELWVFVGSEGGFSLNEVEEFKSMSLPSVSLGEQVLRVETACLSLIAILKYEFGLIR